MTRTAAILEELRRYESRNITFMEPDGSWPRVWSRARGVHVWDVEGRRYLDLTAAFGVAAAGHANPRVVRAGQRQMAILLHAMGDVHPHPLKARLARELSRLTFERWASTSSADDKPQALRASTVAPGPSAARGKTIFCNSGFEAVEAALKTALLATGKPGVIAFAGAYHGTGYGTLNATHRVLFKAPFRRQLADFAHFVPFPLQPREIERVGARVATLLRKQRIGAVLVEPVQGRGGVRVPPPAFLPILRNLCTDHGALLIVDEIFTGFGRTGRWFAVEHSGVVPDQVCLGKALTGGFPLSACVGRADLMDRAWPASDGEAIHTSTYLGHPVGCAMALAQIEEIRRRRLVERSEVEGSWLRRTLRSMWPGIGDHVSVRGLGLMAGIELKDKQQAPATSRALAVVKAMLGRGYILLPEGEHSNVLALTPPLIITRPQLTRAIMALVETVQATKSSKTLRISPGFGRMISR